MIPISAERTTGGVQPEIKAYKIMAVAAQAAIIPCRTLSKDPSKKITAATKAICVPETDRMWTIPVVAKLAITSLGIPV
ncbi:hypothetical protein SDC9_129533 [bioreactor metagenome]|uniref:Uncharacterized protein n=1 Tax=bioreactor metagenome TaxID=1076179 RepID=A0A645D104_9ZZZZ